MLVLLSPYFYASFLPPPAIFWAVSPSKYASLRKFTPFIICQFIYQVTILATTTIEAWRALDDQQEKYLCVLKMLTMSVKILMASNLTAISTMTALSDHSNVDKKGPQKLLVSVALCLGLIGLTVLWWNNSLPHEVVAPSVPRYINTILGFVLLLLLVGSIKHTERDQNIAENLKSISLCDILTDNKTFYVRCSLVIIVLWSVDGFGFGTVGIPRNIGPTKRSSFKRNRDKCQRWNHFAPSINLFVEVKT